MKKKIVFVIPHLTIGGVQKSLITALKVIDYNEFDVTLYLRKNRTDLLPFVDERVNVIINDDKTHYYRKPYAVLLQILVEFWKALGKKAKVEKYNNKLKDAIVNYSMEYEKKRFFSSEKYDIAIAYVQGYTALFVAECVNAEKKYVFFHTSVDELHEVHEKCIDKFQKIVAIHNEQKELIKQWYPSVADRIVVVENYCDKTLIEVQSKEFTVNKPENKLVLCSCGRFSKVKGFDIAVESAKLLKEKNIPFLWYFVGDGPEKNNIEKLIKQHDLNENIVITGMKKNPYPYIKACDIYVQPSREDAMPLTLIEAKSLKKVCVATATVGGKKLVNNNIDGVICEINAYSISEAVIDLVSNKDKHNDMKAFLNNVDYSKEAEHYKKSWQKLLEE